MTIDIETSITMDVSKENETYNIDASKLPEGIRVAACRWLSSLSPHYEAQLSVLKLIFSLMKIKLPSLKLWIFIGDSAWQDDTRIIRYKKLKLWRGLSSRNIEIMHSGASYEMMLEREGKLRFFGAKMLSELSLESVARALVTEHCSYLLALPDQIDIQAALSLGWEIYDGFDKTLLEYAICANGFIFKVVGRFDDPESGFVGLGDPKLIKKLV